MATIEVRIQGPIRLQEEEARDVAAMLSEVRERRWLRGLIELDEDEVFRELDQLCVVEGGAPRATLRSPVGVDQDHDGLLLRLGLGEPCVPVVPRERRVPGDELARGPLRGLGWWRRV